MALTTRSPSEDLAAAGSFVDLVGGRLWTERLGGLRRLADRGGRSGRAFAQRYAVEFAIDRLRQRMNRPPSLAERLIGQLARFAREVHDGLPPCGRDRLCGVLRAALAGDETLIGPFHMLRTGLLQRERGYDVLFAGLADGAPFDLLIQSDGIEAEIACDVISAEAGRSVQRGVWFRLADRIDPDLQTWLSAHPGRYVLKMTLPHGLQGGLHDSPDAASETLAVLHERIRVMLTTERRSDHDEAIVLRLDPLLLAAAQADELGLVSSLRREFGPEAHLSVTASGGGLFVMAARAGRENDIACAVRRRMAVIAPARLTGTRPGILAMFIEDTDREEWRGLRERLELEGEARQFLTCPVARQVVAVTCASRLELFGVGEPDGAPDGEMRFRNPSHPAAKLSALSLAVQSSI